jgi:hypothetical protein
VDDGPVATTLPAMRQPVEGTGRERLEPQFHFCCRRGARAHQVGPVMADHLAAAEATGKRRSDGSWRRGTWIGGFGVRSESSVTKKFQRKAMEEGGPASPLMMGTSGGAGASAATGKNGARGGGVGIIVDEGLGKASRPVCTSGAR